MVYAFFIHSLDAPTVFLSYFYTPEGNNVHQPKRQEYIVNQVLDDFRYRALCDRGIDNRIGETYDGTVKHLAQKEGIFRVPINSTTELYFSQPKFILWRRALGALYTLVIESDENRLLASNFLSLFGKVLSDHFKLISVKSGGPSSSNINPQNPSLGLTPTSEFFMRPEEVIVLLQHYLPNGQLLFLSTQFSKHVKANITF
eukprot:TRINITY_DN2526_c0_g2_i1.p1 TRINITY_DN2526_c0_g2~~TRINITY_DN2526_c0_g2_i1.p1  ORF type:complete len:223 (+),score=35.89 TRINITY_DN2526_c0_g2_i1:69-671(+)